MQFSKFARKAVLISMVQLFTLLVNPNINDSLTIQTATAQEVVQPDQDNAQEAPVQSPEVQLPKPILNQREMDCLADNVFYEARGEPRLGKIAIAYVTLNRVASGQFSNTICGVVHQRNRNGCQFSWVCSRPKTRREPQVYNDILLIAEHVMSYNELDPTHGALYFERYNRHYKHRLVLARIGHHVFYSNGKIAIDVKDKQDKKLC